MKQVDSNNLIEYLDTINKDWFGIHVKSRHEFKILRMLIKTRVEAFLPVVERLRKWKNMTKCISFPLFPGYIFVNIQKDYRSILNILKIKGVVRFLCTVPGEPEPIPREQIDSLKRLVENKEIIDPYPYLKEGQKVRIKKGPLAGVEGVLTERHGRHFLVVAVDIIQQGVSVKVCASDVEPI